METLIDGFSTLYQLRKSLPVVQPVVGILLSLAINYVHARNHTSYLLIQADMALSNST